MIVICNSANLRSRSVARALRVGARRRHLNLRALPSRGFGGFDKPGTVFMFYGLKEHLELWEAAKAAGSTVVFFDLGYWNRSDNHDDRGGHYRAAVNGLHPTPEHILTTPPNFKKLEAWPLKARTHQKIIGNHALIVGMSPKAAEVFGYAPFEWETQMAKRLTAAGLRPYYRPKPTIERPRPVEGAVMLDPKIPAEIALNRTDYLVAHHSNMSLEACALDVPFYCEMGAAKALSAPTIELLPTYRSPPLDARLDVLARAAAWQWSLEDMEAGNVFRDLTDWGFLKP